MARKWRGHFDSTPDDERLLMAEDWAKFFRDLITTGVRNGGENLQTVAGEHLNVNIKTGMANIEGYILRIEEDENGSLWPLTIAEPHNQYPRIDRVILRLDRSIQTRDITPMILTGAAGSNPNAPELTRNGVVWDISLARINVAANATVIRESEITDERFDESVCGLINSVLGLDSSEWQRQYDEFIASVNAQNQEFIDERNNSFTSALNAFNQSAADILDLFETTAFTYTNNNFDDWSVKPGTTRSTKFNSDGSVLERYVLTAAPSVIIADKLTEFPDDSTVVETVNFHAYSFTIGANTVKTTESARIKTTAFNADGTIEEVVT
jgi:hypothetical protein